MGANAGNNYRFFNITKGFLTDSAKKQFRSYTGTLLSIEEVTDTFEEKPVAKIQLKMKDSDSDEVACIRFTKKGWYAHGFFSRIGRVDVMKKFTLGASGSDKSEKVSFCWMKQEDIPVPADKENFPLPPKIDLGDGAVTDWRELMKQIPGIITAIKNELPNEAGRGELPVTNVFEKKAQEEAAKTPIATDRPKYDPTQDDDLPF